MSDAVTHNGATNGTTPQPQASLTAALGRRSVVLVGMMGAGKSSVGRRLAGRLGIPFVDADVEIEKAAGMTISEIFAAQGEPYFRAGEMRVIARLLDGGPQVLATGGGAFMNAETRTAVRAKGISVWLRATLEVLNRRIKRRGDRPLLKGADPSETLRRLLEERDPVYAEADLTVESRDVPHETIVDEILEGLRTRVAPADAAAGGPLPGGAAP
jgi:shikimate kinase